MSWPRKSGRHRTVRLSKARLYELIEEATVDAYDESEQRMGFYTLIEDNLRFPFEQRRASRVHGLDQVTHDQLISGFVFE